MTTRARFGGLLFSAAAVLLWGWVSTASADPIGPNCGTCQGSIYTLLNLGQLDAPGGTSDVFRIELLIDTSGYSAGGTFIDSASVKVTDTATSVVLNAAPGGTSNWTPLLGGINAGGCAANSNNGFVCASDNVSGTGGQAPVPDGIYAWIFDITMGAGTLSTSASIKARYVDNAGGKVGDLVSEDISLQTPETPPSNVPEPGSLLLLGSGLAGLGAWRRRRGKRA